MSQTEIQNVESQLCPLRLQMKQMAASCLVDVGVKKKVKSNTLHHGTVWP